VADQKFWLPIMLAVVMAIGLALFYSRTMYGKLFVAMSEDAFAARARGVSTDRIRVASYVLAGALGGSPALRPGS
jgi:branched-chain amino acid transport system permease protein